MERLARVFLHDGCVVRSVHQRSQIFTGAGSGLQCVANVICILLKSTQKSHGTWITSDISDILELGHILYIQIGKVCKLLLPSDVPQYVCLWIE